MPLGVTIQVSVSDGSSLSVSPELIIVPFIFKLPMSEPTSWKRLVAVTRSSPYDPEELMLEPRLINMPSKAYTDFLNTKLVGVKHCPPQVSTWSKSQANIP